MTTEVPTDDSNEITMTTETLTEENIMSTAQPEGSTESATDPHREPPVTGLHDRPADIRALEAENFLLAPERNSLQATRAELIAELTAALTAAEARITNLTAERDSAQAALANLATDRDSLQRRLSQALSDEDTKLERFKQQVVDVAVRYAARYDLCDTGMNEALEELDLHLPSKSYRATLQITVQFTAEMSSQRDLPDESWVADSIRRNDLRRAIYNTFSMDGDHSDSSVQDVEMEITDVSELDND